MFSVMMENRGGQEQEAAGDVLRQSAQIDFVGAQQIDALRREWKIGIEPQVLRGHCPESHDSFTVSRESVRANVSFFDGLLAPHAISIREPRLRFRFQPEAYRKIKNWAGPEALLRGVLANRIDWALPLGILAMLSALPASAVAGAEAVPFHVLRAVLGAGLVAQVAAAQKWCHPGFLLLQAVWLLALGVATGVSIQEGASPWWGLAMVGHGVAAYSGLRDWLRFRQGTY